MSLLRHRDNYITNDIWEGNERVLHPRQHVFWILKNTNHVDVRIRIVIGQAGFGHILKLDNMEINH